MIARCLSKNAEERPAGAREVVAELSSGLVTPTISTVDNWQARWISAAAVALAAIAVSGTAWIRAWEKNSPSHAGTTFPGTAASTAETPVTGGASTPHADSIDAAQNEALDTDGASATPSTMISPPSATPPATGLAQPRPAVAASATASPPATSAPTAGAAITGTWINNQSTQTFLEHRRYNNRLTINRSDGEQRMNVIVNLGDLAPCASWTVLFHLRIREQAKEHVKGVIAAAELLNAKKLNGLDWLDERQLNRIRSFADKQVGKQFTFVRKDGGIYDTESKQMWNRVR